MNVGAHAISESRGPTDREVGVREVQKSATGEAIFNHILIAKGSKRARRRERRGGH